MPKIAIVDTYYPDFLTSWHFNESAGYESELSRLLDFSFGTGRGYSSNLRALGWDVIDIVANAETVQSMWAREHMCYSDILGAQIQDYAPDVVLLQDLSITWESRYKPAIIAAQCSCRLPEIELVKRCNVVFSSFQFYVPKFAEVGVKCVYLPLAFEPSVLVGEQPDRDIDISFVGGLGRELYWKKGTDTLEAVAAAFGLLFHWYGYGLEYLAQDSPLRMCYRGEAWGKDMYDVYRRSKIVVNRHGEIAQGFMNNLRAYEATGCGALLLTEEAPNLKDFFEDREEVMTYKSPAQAVYTIQALLERPERIKWTATNGQARTLRDHTYEKRMRVVSDTLKELL